MIGTVAIVGRPNVGKSTIFNRMTKRNDAIVDSRPGVTRDRLFGLCETVDSQFIVIDTGGFETDEFNFQPFEENIVWENTKVAIEQSDLVIFVMDGKAGLNPHDEFLFRFLEKLGKPFLTVVNKIDGCELQSQAFEFYQMGVTEFLTTSAVHNRGVWDVCEKIVEKLTEMGIKKSQADDGKVHNVAIVGRPNAGKSSLLNRLIGEDRAIVSEISGTTRDAVDAEIRYHGERFRIIDTAGIRRKSKIKDKIESLSVMQSLRAISQADVVLLVIDALAGMTEQDCRLADLAVSRHKPLLIVVNKWDLFPDKKTSTPKEYAAAIHREIKSMSYAPITFISCKTNQRVHTLLAKGLELLNTSHKRIGTAELNRILEKIVGEHTPALIRNHTKRVKFYYATQVKGHPPTIVIFTNVADEIQESYKRYMANRFRKELGFEDIPLRIFYRSKSEVNEKKQTRGEIRA